MQHQSLVASFIVSTFLADVWSSGLYLSPPHSLPDATKCVAVVGSVSFNLGTVNCVHAWLKYVISALPVTHTVQSLGTCHNGCTLYGCFRLLHEVVTRVHHSMHALGVLKLRHCVLLHYSVNAGEAPMTRRRVHGKHLGLRSDLGYGGLSTPSTDSGYEGSSTALSDSEYRGSSTASTDFVYRGLSRAATSTHSTSHLVKRYQKMSMHPLAEGKLRYGRTGLPRTVDCVVRMCRTLPEPDNAQLGGS